MTYKHSIHEAVLQRGWGEVNELVARGEHETVDLDFKNKSDPSHGALDKKDREVLAQALTALANSMGGAIVYGIDCRVSVDGVDEASAIKPIQGIKKFASEVRTNIPNLVMPRLEDVSVDLVANPAQPNAGIVVISVGRSERRPHRSEAAGDKRYYKRSGSNTVQMEHFDIEDAFRRIAVARLAFDPPVALGGGTTSDVEHRFLRFFLRNVSNVSAKFPFVEVETIRGGLVYQYGIDGNGSFPLEPNGQLRVFSGDANTAIHPGQTLEIFRLVFHVHRQTGKINTSNQIATGRENFVSISESPLELVLRVACENSPLLDQSFRFNGPELAEVLGIALQREQ